MSNFIRAASLVLIAVAMAASAFAQGAPMTNPPRNKDGRPDLQGFWSNQSVTTLTRDPSITNVVLTPAEAAELESKFHWNVNEASQRGVVDVNKAPPKGLAGSGFGGGGGYNAFWLDHGRHYARVKGEIRSSWLVDPPNGRLPTKASNRRNEYDAYGTFDGPETRPMAERCVIGFSQAAGPVIRNGLYNNNLQIVQTPSHVLISVEMNHDAKIIPLVKARSEWKPRPDAIKPWFGDAFAWYDGDTLVVETTSVNPEQKALMSPTGKLTERFTRWSEDEILYEFTVEDPELYTAIWKGEMALRKSTEPLYEYACHEGNYALPGILAGARKQEADGKTVAKNAEVE